MGTAERVGERWRRLCGMKKVSEASEKTCEQERMLEDEERGEKMGKNF